MIDDGNQGWKVRFRFRSIHKRKRVGGRARGFYEGNYVYVRVTDPMGRTRDFYCGVGGAPAGELKKRGVEKSTRPRSSSSSAEKKSKGRKQGQKAGALDTRDPADDRTRPMFR